MKKPMIYVVSAEYVREYQIRLCFLRCYNQDCGFRTLASW